MRWILALTAVLVGCGGSENSIGDSVVAELRSGTPYCAHGTTGPSVTAKTMTVKDQVHPPYVSTIIECDWTCGSLGSVRQAFVYVFFYTDANGVWQMDPHADPGRKSCP